MGRERDRFLTWQRAIERPSERPSAPSYARFASFMPSPRRKAKQVESTHP